jgi:hypothetical protein
MHASSKDTNKVGIHQINKSFCWFQILHISHTTSFLGLQKWVVTHVIVMCELVMVPNKKHALQVFSFKILHKSELPWTRLTGFQGEWVRVLAFEKAYFWIFSPYLVGFYISPYPTTSATMGLWAARKKWVFHFISVQGPNVWFFWGGYQWQGAERHLSGFWRYMTLKDSMHTHGIAFFGHLDVVKFEFELWLYLDS